jgi:hypothetical protein
MTDFEDAHWGSMGGPLLLADWCFDDATNPFVDCTGKGHDAVVGEGTPLVEEGVLLLDGQSGLKVKLADAFKRNDFVVEARVYPTAFSALGMDNIIAAEPPGRGPDGWVLRLDTAGFPTVYVRDDAWGADWKSIRGPKMEPNQWHVLKLVRSGATTTLWVNGQIAAKSDLPGDIGTIQYDLGIGYDAMNQRLHDRRFAGKIDYIRYYAIE